MSCCYLQEDHSKYINKEYTVNAGPFYSVMDVIGFTAYYVSYEENKPAQTPSVTFNRRLGDCEDYCILAMYLIKRDIGIIPRMGICDLSHTFIEIHGVFYEPQNGTEVTLFYKEYFNTINFMDYEDAIALCY